MNRDRQLLNDWRLTLEAERILDAGDAAMLKIWRNRDIPQAQKKSPIQAIARETGAKLKAIGFSSRRRVSPPR
jgi:hypothetical protein